MFCLVTIKIQRYFLMSLNSTAINLAYRQDKATSQRRGVLSLALGLALALQAADARPGRLTDHTSSTTTGLDENGA